MTYKVLTYNNQVGIVTDAELLVSLIKNNIICDVKMEFIDQMVHEKCDVGIWIQNFNINLLHLFRKNIFFINEEWAGKHELSNLNLFDHVVCKSKYAYDIIKNYCNAIYLPFISKDLYNPNIKRTNSFLHFMGRSIQKNTELVLNQEIPITLIDPYNRYKPNPNFNHINVYQTKEHLLNLLNSHNIHICCSLYESWGHYLFEGLSTGAEIICSDIPVFKEQLDPELVHFIPTHEKIDMSYMYCSDNTNNVYKFRKSFFVYKDYFKNYIENFKPIGKNEERRKLFNNIIKKNEEFIKYFFKNI